VVEVRKDDAEIVRLEQTRDGVKQVVRTTCDRSSLETGWIRAYRPVKK
jgi:hypothetical protein